MRSKALGFIMGFVQLNYVITSDTAAVSVLIEIKSKNGVLTRLAFYQDSLEVARFLAEVALRNHYCFAGCGHDFDE